MSGRRLASAALILLRQRLSIALAINSVTGMCITKLDVLDGLETLKICVSYRLNGKSIDVPPVGADLIEQCTPEYIELPGWSLQRRPTCASSRNCARRRLPSSPPARTGWRPLSRPIRLPETGAG